MNPKSLVNGSLLVAVFFLSLRFGIGVKHEQRGIYLNARLSRIRVADILSAYEAELQ